MKLTGTIQERIHALIEFGKAHRSINYDAEYEKHVEEYYQKLGVKFTDAARNFWREYAGVLDNMWLYPDGPTISCDDGRRFLSAINFDFYCITEELLTEWCVPQPDDFSPDYVGIIWEKYGEDTVLVAYGGYYYPRLIWVRPDGRLIAIMPDDGTEKYYDNLEEFLCYQLESEHPSWLEVVTESLKLKGMLEERLHAAIDFAKNHGGFEYCTLLDDNWGNVPFDLSKMAGCDGCSDAEIFDKLYHEVSIHELMWSSDKFHGMYLPGKIQAVKR